MKVSYRKILAFILIKYLLFYVFMMLKNTNYALVNIEDLNSLGDVFYYLWIFLFLPFVSFVLFAFPINLSFQKRSWKIFILINILVLVTEYFVYTYLASQLDLLNGLFNAIASVLCFVLIFYREIKTLNKG